MNTTEAYKQSAAATRERELDVVAERLGIIAGGAVYRSAKIAGDYGRPGNGKRASQLQGDEFKAFMGETRKAADMLRLARDIKELRGTDVRVVSEPRTYSAESSWSWWHDRITVSTRGGLGGDVKAAEERLAKHSREVQHDLAEGNTAGRYAEDVNRTSVRVEDKHRNPYDPRAAADASIQLDVFFRSCQRRLHARMPRRRAFCGSLGIPSVGGY